MRPLFPIDRAERCRELAREARVAASDLPTAELQELYLKIARDWDGVVVDLERAMRESV